MKKGAYSVEDFMTKAPHAIEPHEPIAVAIERMRALKVLHLPVRRAGRAVGILSERDLGLLAGLKGANGRALDLKTLTVEEVMTPDPHCVAPETPLRDVATAMAEAKIGSALVVDTKGQLVGIFTATDALKALASVL